MLIRLPRFPRSRRRSVVRHKTAAECRLQNQLSESLEQRLVLTTPTVGVITNNAAEVFDGYNLLHPSNSGTTYLLDNDGEVVHSWQSDYRPMSAYLLEDGSLLRVARLPNLPTTMNAGGGAGRVELFDWDGNLTWFYDIYDTTGMEGDFRAHHDIELLPNGNILMIAWERLSDETAIEFGRSPDSFDSPSEGIWPEVIFEIQPDLAGGSGGEVVWEWHAKDHLIQDVDPTKDNFGVVADHPELIDFNYVVGGTGRTGKLADWNHANAIDYSPELDQIVISLRSQSEFWVIDHSTTTEEAASHSGGNSGRGGDLLYRWGNEAAYGKGDREDQELFFQHDSQFIPEGLPGAGNILVFNNGWNRPDRMGGFENFSSAEEVVTPLIDQQWHLAQLMDGSMGDVVSFATHPAPAEWQPIVGDWNGDGVETTGGFDPESGTFYLNDANADGRDAETEWTSPLSGPGLVPVAGDWDGDGIDSVGVFDPASTTFTLFNSGAAAGSISVSVQNAGAGVLTPLAGDWDGDGFDTIGVYDATGTVFRYTDRLVFTDVTAWSVLDRADAGTDWNAIVGDWDGDGADSIGWYDAANSEFQFVNDQGNPTEAFTSYVASDAGDLWRPIAGDWNNDGSTTVGLYDPDYGDYVLGEDGVFGPEAPVWEHVLPPEEFSSIVSGVQRLENGNTLIAAGPVGTAVEVNPAGEVVWKYVSPVLGDNSIVHQGDEPPLLPQQANVGVRFNIVFRFTRYAVDYPAFEGRDLTPQGVLERTDPDVVVQVDGDGNLTVTDIINGGSATLSLNSRLTA